MELHALVDGVIADAFSSLWPAFAPEVVLCATILLMLTIRALPFGQYADAALITLVGSAVALYFAYPWVHLQNPGGLQHRELFMGMLVYDTFTVYMRAVLVFFTFLFAVFTKLTGVPDKDDGPDFYCLVLGAVLGMCLMASANHLLMIFLAVEMASVPSYALSGILKTRRVSSEAALKYSVYGAGAAGVMLYGISLLAGMTNTAHLPTLAVRLSEMDVASMGQSEQMVLALAGLMVMVGLAFKLSAVPFHFWCPDVFEGATAEVGAFLSIASKAAALALLVRVCLGVGLLPQQHDSSQPEPTAVVQTAGLFAVQDDIGNDDEVEPAGDHEDADGSASGAGSLGPVRQFVGLLVGVFAAITCTFGNLAAYGQTNIKRLLAYSTIAHAGYMMLPVPAALAVAVVAPESAKAAIASIVLYIAIYLFMNLGAFAVVAILRNTLGTEEIADYSGLIRRAPIVVICFGLIMFSLVGLPPLAGFVGKFALFASLADAYRVTGKFHLIALLVIGGLNTAISLYYYLRVIKVMAMDPESDCVASSDDALIPVLPGAFVVLITAPVALLIINWNMLGKWSLAAAEQLF